MLDTQIKAVEERLRSLHARIARKIWRDSVSTDRWHDSFQSWSHLGTSYALNRCLREATFPTLWKLWGRADAKILDEQVFEEHQQFLHARSFHLTPWFCLNQ